MTRKERRDYLKGTTYFINKNKMKLNDWANLVADNLLKGKSYMQYNEKLKNDGFELYLQEKELQYRNTLSLLKIKDIELHISMWMASTFNDRKEVKKMRNAINNNVVTIPSENVLSDELI